MAVRRERVELDLIDNLTPGLTRAAVASRALKGELNDLGKTSTRSSDGLDDTAKSAALTGRNASKAGPEIDRFSGRLKLLRDVAILLGPVIAPLGAASIPLLTGALVGLGAASGAVGASVLALKGLGDGIKALDAYQLEPTADNLQALRIEMEKLGPSAIHFVHFLDGIGGELKSLQTVARNGLLPGLEDGIDAALERLPGVRKVIRELAEGVGELATTAGEDLAPGGDWDAFFQYLDTDGKRTLESFGDGIGNIANGLADMLVAFAPVTRDFTHGFDDMADSFADWAAGLSDSESFGEFLDYIRVNGPRAIDLLGSIAHTFADIAEAAAPVGAVTLPILTSFLKLVGVLAASPMGTPFVAAVVGITAYSRAVDVASASQSRFNKIASLNPWLIVAAAVTTAVVSMQNANDDLVTSTDAAQDALDSFDPSQMEAALASLNDKLDETALKAYPDIDPNQSFLDRFKDGIPVIGGLGDALDQAGALWVRFTGAEGQASDATSRLVGNLEILGGQTRQTQGLAALFGETVAQTGRRMRVAAGDAEAFTGAIAELNGWLDKRQALRDYEASIRGLSRSMRNGFTRKDVENLDQVGRNIIQVASQIKDKSVRAQFLEEARGALEDLATRGGPRAQAQIQKIIDKMVEVGLVDAKPTVDADTAPAEKAIARTNRQFDIMNALETKSTINADDTKAQLVIRRTRLELSRIPDENVYVNIIRRGVANAGALGVGPAAINNESNQRVSGRASAAPTALTFGRGMSDDKASLYGFGARGGPWADVEAQARGAAESLKHLRHRLTEAERAVDRERRQRDALVGRREDVRNAITSDLQSDLFAVSEASSDPWAADATAGGTMNPLAAAQERRDRAKRYVDAIRALKGKGLRGTAIQQIISEGLEAAEFMAAQPLEYLNEFTSTLAEAAQYTTQAGNIGANAVVSVAEMNAANAELRAANKTLKDIEKAIKAAEKTNDKAHDRNADKVSAGVNGAAKRARNRVLL